MVRAGAHLAAGAIAAALLLTGAGGAVAVADTPADSAVSKNANGTAPDSSAAAAEHSVDNNTFSSSENARSAGEQADNAVASNGSDAKDPPRVGSGDEQINEKKPDHDPGTSDSPGDKTINKVPQRPEAPPRVDLAPLPEAPPRVDLAPLPGAPPPVDLAPLPQAPPRVDLAPLPQAPAPETPPPADLPPIIPATPVDPDTVDAAAGEAGQRPGGNEPPVLTVPFLVAPALLPPVHILGASIAPRWTLGGRAVDPTPGWAGEPSPRLLRASDGRPLHKPALTNFGLTAREQTPYRTGYADYSSRSLAQTAAGALPGLAGLVIMTASGICLGYRQANTAQQLRTAGIGRFLS